MDGYLNQSTYTALVGLLALNKHGNMHIPNQSDVAMGNQEREKLESDLKELSGEVRDQCYLDTHVLVRICMLVVILARSWTMTIPS